MWLCQLLQHFGLKNFLLGDFECVEKEWLPDLFVYLLFYALEWLHKEWTLHIINMHIFENPITVESFISVGVNVVW